MPISAKILDENIDFISVPAPVRRHRSPARADSSSRKNRIQESHGFDECRKEMVYYENKRVITLIPHGKKYEELCEAVL